MKRLRSRLLLSCALALFLLSAAPVAVTSGIVPPNDDCNDAAPIEDVNVGDVLIEVPFDTTHAPFDGLGIYMITPNIWYNYVPTRTGCSTVSLRGSQFDTKLAVYDGNDCDPNLARLIKVSDDFWRQQAELTFPVTAGKPYLIEVGGFNMNVKGQGVISIVCDEQSMPPANDDCNDADHVGNVQNLPFDTTCATADGDGHCRLSPNVWYRYTAVSTGDVTVSLVGSEYDTALAVYDGVDCYPIRDDMIQCNDDFGNHLTSQITFPATAGDEYLIEVGGYNLDSVGPGLLSISAEGAPVPPSNDECDNAEAIGDVADLVFDTTVATFDGPGLCMGSSNIWYCYTASCTGDVTVSLIGSSYDTMLAVYNGCACDLTSDDMIECDDDSGGNYTSVITFAAVAGNKYLIEIGGYAFETGQGVLNVICEGVAPQKPDLGDAPDSTNNAGVVMHAYPSQGLLPVLVQANFPTVFNDGSGTGPYGPVHLNPLAVAFLGEKISHEVEADIGPDQDGLNNIDPAADTADQDKKDDGVVFPLNLPHCQWATFDYIVNVVTPGTDLWVNVWCDWNRDGDWDDTLGCTRGPAPEWAVQNQLLFNLPAGLNQITTPAFLSSHPQEGAKDIWMRITLSEQPWKGGSNPGEAGNGGSGPQSKYEIGETEDYYFVPDVSHTICEDLNGDGVVDIIDLVEFVNEWFETCL
jgi:hypothetical protein